MEELDVFEQKRHILLKNKAHILRMPNTKKKAEMIQAYYGLLNYYQTISGEDITDGELDIDDEFTSKFDKCSWNDSAKKLVELEENAQKLYDIFQTIIDYYKDNEFCEYQYVAPIKVNKKIMDKALSDFFASLGEDVFKIYYNMIRNGNVASSNILMDKMGFSVNSTPIDNASIVVQNVPYYLDYYTTLAHEVGHCYQFYLQKNQRHYGLIDPYCEITSMLFEKLFIEYLRRMHLIDDELKIKLEDNIYFLNNICISKALFKLLMNNKIGIIDPTNLSYTCKVDEKEIMKEIINDCGYIEPLHAEPDLYEIHYSFGNIISNYFFDRITKDFNNEWKNFKDFMCTINYLPMNEVIDEYFEIEKIDEKIKKLTKSYRER